MGLVREMIIKKKRFFGVLMPVMIAFGALSCWDMDNPLRSGQGGPGVPATVAHRDILGGTNHASGYCRPLLNCAACHGDSLQGGVHGEPSCTKCHADNWSGAICGTIAHTVNLGGHLHASDYCKPFDSCVRCHGQNLRGGFNGEPSCFSCHGDRWSGGDCGD